MKNAILIAALVLAAAPLQAKDWSLTGPRGGTVTGSGSCSAGNATLTCDRAGVYTGLRGLSLDHSAARVSDSTGTVKTLTTTGPKGRSVTTTRSRSRSPRG